MSYELKELDPTKCKYSFRLGKFDCYELRKGVCSLYLSEDEAERISIEEGNEFHDSNVMSCRELAKSLLNDNYFENPSFQESVFSIKMHPRDCGHFVFSDGQHRTCIAKHLNINSMYANIENYPRDYSLICRACYSKQKKEIENRKIINRMISKLKWKKVKEKEIPSDLIDEEYMNFKEK
ncbi:hypothetical protein [Peribacillus sp. NPDC056705]|uniref:hypothetical protein n=1 Tax=Peribacillus sp. NPDC056705 TaxID=3345918 RepID=UPI0037489572